MANLLEQCYQGVLSKSKSIQDFILEDTKWHISFPINTLSGVQDIQEHYFSVLLKSLPDAERKPFIAFEGEYKNQNWICATGYIVGTFSHDFLEIPATGKALFLRYTEFAEVTTSDDDKGRQSRLKQVYTFIDIIDVMNQAGVNPIRPSLGHDGLIMPPTTLDGIKSDLLSSGEGKYTENLVEDMLTELGRYDGKSLASINLEKYWHPNFIWYGPAGIGTTRGIEGFRKHHQGPFLEGFPDRGIDKTLCLISHGNYAATGGWPHMYGTHTGNHWLGLNPSGKRVYPRVMDIWRRENDLLVENWVAIDIPDMLAQMNIDIFDLMKDNINKKNNNHASE